MNKQSKVYIVCEPTHRIAGERIRAVDLSPAAEYGEPIILLKSTSSLIDSQPLVETLCERLATFCDDDWLVPIGEPALMCIAAMVAASMNKGRVKFLKWDRQLSRYIPIKVYV